MYLCTPSNRSFNMINLAQDQQGIKYDHICCPYEINRSCSWDTYFIYQFYFALSHSWLVLYLGIVFVRCLNVWLSTTKPPFCIKYHQNLKYAYQQTDVNVSALFSCTVSCVIKRTIKNKQTCGLLCYPSSQVKTWCYIPSYMYSIYYFFCLDFCFSCLCGTDSCLHFTSVFICIPTASQGKCLVWRNPIWLRLLLLPLIVLALIPSIKENIGFGPAQVSGKGDQSVGSNHSWVCVYTVGMSSTYVSTYTRVPPTSFWMYSKQRARVGVRICKALSGLKADLVSRAEVLWSL